MFQEYAARSRLTVAVVHRGEREAIVRQGQDQSHDSRTPCARPRRRWSMLYRDNFHDAKRSRTRRVDATVLGRGQSWPADDHGKTMDAVVPSHSYHQSQSHAASKYHRHTPQPVDRRPETPEQEWASRRRRCPSCRPTVAAVGPSDVCVFSVTNCTPPPPGMRVTRRFQMPSARVQDRSRGSVVSAPSRGSVSRSHAARQIFYYNLRTFWPERNKI